jgi:hypothetical protein
MFAVRRRVGVVIKIVDEHHSDKRIGRGDPILWPSSSPNLTPYDFLLIRLLETSCMRFLYQKDSNNDDSDCKSHTSKTSGRGHD